MSVKLFSVTTFDMNGEDLTYTVCAEDPTDAAVLAMEDRLKNEKEGDLEDLRSDTCGDLSIVVIATLGSFDNVGVIEPGEHVTIPNTRIFELLAARLDTDTPKP